MNHQAKNKLGIRGKYQITTYKAGTKEVLRKSPWIENLVVANSTSGVGLITQHLAGNTANPLEIDKAAIGTGTTSPTVADTGLETAVLTGIERTGISATDTSVTVDFFITDGELANGTYSEFGIFADTRLFARSIISPAFTKASGEDVSINYQITFSSS